MIVNEGVDPADLVVTAKLHTAAGQDDSLHLLTDDAVLVDREYGPPVRLQRPPSS